MIKPMSENEFRYHTKMALTSKYFWKYHSEIASSFNRWNGTHPYLVQAKMKKLEYIRAYIILILGFILMAIIVVFLFTHLDFLRSGLPSGNETVCWSKL